MQMARVQSRGGEEKEGNGGGKEEGKGGGRRKSAGSLLPILPTRPYSFCTFARSCAPRGLLAADVGRRREQCESLDSRNSSGPPARWIVRIRHICHLVRLAPAPAHVGGDDPSAQVSGVTRPGLRLLEASVRGGPSTHCHCGCWSNSVRSGLSRVGF